MAVVEAASPSDLLHKASATMAVGKHVGQSLLIMVDVRSWVRRVEAKTMAAFPNQIMVVRT